MDATERIRRRGIAVHAVFAASGVALAGLAARMPTLREDLGLTTAELGLLLLALYSGSVAGLAISARIVSRAGSRATIVAALALGAAGLAATGTAASLLHDPRVAAGGLLAFGLGSGVCNVAMNAAGASVESALRRPVMPRFHAAFSIGAVAGSAVAALGAALRLPMAADLAAIAAVLLVAAAVAAPRLEAGAPARLRTAAPGRTAWRERRTLLIGLLLLATGFAAGAANDWLSVAMVDGHGSPDAVGAVVYGAFAVAVACGRLGGVAVLARFGRVAVLRGSAALLAAGVILVVIAPHPAIAFLGAALWGLGTALGFPVGMSAAADEPARAEARIGVVATMSYAASLLGPPLIGGLGSLAGVLPALAIVLVFAALAAVLAGTVRERST